MDLTQLNQAEEHLRRARDLTPAGQFLLATADALVTVDTDQPVGHIILGLALTTAGLATIGQYPHAVQDDVIRRAGAVLPPVRTGITIGEYAVLLRDAARGA